MKRKKSDCLFFFLYFVIYLYFFFTGVRTGRFSEAFLFSSWLVMLYFFFIVISEEGINVREELKRGMQEARESFLNSEDIRECGKVETENDRRGEKEMQKCPVCGAWFKTKKALHIHMTKRHKKKKKNGRR